MSEWDFEAECRNLGISLDQHQVAAFAAYRDLILRAAARFNLTAVRDPQEIERRHFVESLALGVELLRDGALEPVASVRVIDVGAGAGMPGLPLKIAYPRMRLSLLESNARRCAFLRSAVGRLGLEDTEVLEGRAEEWGRREAHRDRYDLAIARAVAPLPVLLEYALPFLRPGGVLAAPKGSAAARELAGSEAALRELRGAVQSAGAFLPPGGPPQTLILIRKTGPTPERYPRRPGIPAKRPLS